MEGTIDAQTKTFLPPEFVAEILKNGIKSLKEHHYADSTRLGAHFLFCNHEIFKKIASRRYLADVLRNIHPGCKESDFEYVSDYVIASLGEETPRHINRGQFENYLDPVYEIFIPVCRRPSVFCKVVQQKELEHMIPVNEFFFPEDLKGQPHFWNGLDNLGVVKADDKKRLYFWNSKVLGWESMEEEKILPKFSALWSTCDQKVFPGNQLREVGWFGEIQVTFVGKFVFKPLLRFVRDPQIMYFSWKDWVNVCLGCYRTSGDISNAKKLIPKILVLAKELERSPIEQQVIEFLEEIQEDFLLKN
jgi:hypothetical protein